MIRILAVGRIKEAWIRDGIAEYTKRLGRKVGIEEIKDMGKDREGAKLVSMSKGFTVCLDEHGKGLSSMEMAELLKKNPEISFMIGGPDGLSEDVLDKADLRVSLSNMTFTHELARLLLIEQIYRGTMINQNRPYHR